MNIEEIVYEQINRRLAKLCEFTATPDNGVTRLPFSEEGRQAAEYLKNEMQDAGMTAYIDLVGNVRGVLKATAENAKTILIGSHYDTVKNGGMYDGIAGVVCAISIAQMLKQYCNVRNYDVEVIAFNDEEGMMFGSGCLGSKSLTGQVDKEYLKLTDENGISIREWIERWGENPEDIHKQKIDLDNYSAFYEIHIEQGPVLDKQKKEIGIVTGIVGLIRCMVTVYGRADHAGTTPMDMRKDPMCIASEVISKLPTIAGDENNGAVATCGFIRAYPNAMNVIAHTVEFTIDYRSMSADSIANMESKINKILDEETKKCGASYDIDVKLRQEPVYMDCGIIRGLTDMCSEHGYKYRTLPSGAAHDAMIFADKIPTAMVFAPSKDGRSHCKEEHSSCSDLAKAVQIVFDNIYDCIM